MEKSNYGISTEVQLGFNEAIDKTIELLQEEGFGILSDIDVKQTLKKKLDVDFRNYRILGACNPPMAYQALTEEDEIGLLLPCNVIVFEMDNGNIKVAAINPLVAMSVVGNDKIKPIAREIGAKLESVINRIK